MLRVVSNDDMVKAEEAKIRSDMEDRQNSELILGLAAHVKACWNPARIAKKPIENIMLRALRQRNGEYEADKLSQIKAQGGSEVYMMLTEVKCRGAESWLRDILLDTGSPPWDLSPTPIPDLGPEQEEKIKNIFAQSVIKVLQTSGQAPVKKKWQSLKKLLHKILDLPYYKKHKIVLIK